jgi:hypothetical protein
VERLQLVEVHISKILSTSTINVASNLLSAIQKALTYTIHWLEKHPQLGVLFNTQPRNSSFVNNFSYGNSTCWIPFDMFMENAMDGRHLHVVSAIEVLTGELFAALFCICLGYLSCLCPKTYLLVCAIVVNFEDFFSMRQCIYDPTFRPLSFLI